MLICLPPPQSALQSAGLEVSVPGRSCTSRTYIAHTSRTYIAHIHPAHTSRTYIAHTYPHIHQKCEKWYYHRERSVYTYVCICMYVYIYIYM